MKTCCLASFVLVFCLGTVARADSIVSGGFGFGYPGYSSYSTSGSSTGTLDLNFGSYPGAYASITGSASPTNVQAIMMIGTHSSTPYAQGFGTVTVSMDGWYMLSGGDGFGYADWNLISENSIDGPGEFGPCSVSVDGLTELCDPALDGYGFLGPGETGSFYVPYNTPFQLDFNGSSKEALRR